jgi:hypothetical protein
MSILSIPVSIANRQVLIDGELGRIKGDIKDIIKGSGEWEHSSPVERQRFLRELRQLVLSNIMPQPVPTSPGEIDFTSFVFDRPSVAEIDAMMDTEEMEPFEQV